MKCLGRWLRRVTKPALVLAAAAMACWIWLVPGYVESRVIDALRARGLTDATVHVRAVTPMGVQLADFQTHGASARSIAVTYDGQVTIVGGSYAIAVNNDTLDLGPLTRLEGEGGPLPFERLELDAATLVIAWRDRQWRIPFDAVIDTRADGDADLSAAIHLPGAPIDVNGRINPSTGDADLTAEVAGIKAHYRNNRLTAQYDGQTSQISRVLFGIPLHADRLTASCIFETNPLRATGKLHGEAVRLGAAHIGMFDLAMQYEDGSTNIDATAGPLAIDSETLRAETDELTLTGPPSELRLAFKGARLSLPRQGVELMGMRVDMPIVFGHEPNAGSFAVDRVTVDEDVLPGLTGTGTIVDGLAALDFTWPLLDQATMHGAASIDLSTGSPHGTVNAWINRFEVTDAKQLGRTFHAAEPFEITGSFAVDARAWIDGDRIEPRLTVDAQNAMVRAAQWDVTADGVDAKLTLDGIDPLTSPGGQRIHVDQLRMGRMSFNDGTIAMRIEGRDALLIERTDWRLGDRGRFWAHAIRINPAEAAFDANIFIEDLPLIRWLVMISDKRIEGEGYLFGRLPVKYRPGTRQPLTFGRGYLYSRPGPGWVRVEDRALVEQLLSQAGSPLSQAGIRGQVRNQVVEALVNYEYDMLRFDFLPQEDGGLTLRVATSGHGRGGAKQEIGSLTINFNGFDIVLRTAIMMKRGSDGAIDAALNRFFEPADALEGGDE